MCKKCNQDNCCCVKVISKEGKRGVPGPPGKTGPPGPPRPVSGAGIFPAGTAFNIPIFDPGAVFGGFVIPSDGNYMFQLNVWTQATSLIQSLYTLEATWFINAVIAQQGGANSYIVNQELNDEFTDFLQFRPYVAGDVVTILLKADLNTAVAKNVNIIALKQS